MANLGIAITVLQDALYEESVANTFLDGKILMDNASFASTSMAA
jgi:hypothetical protein